MLVGSTGVGLREIYERLARCLHNILISFRTHNTLYTPEMLTKMAEPFTKALDIVESEKTAILGKKASALLRFLLLSHERVSGSALWSSSSVRESSVQLLQWT
jgi:hypothetical protein